MDLVLAHFTSNLVVQKIERRMNMNRWIFLGCLLGVVVIFAVIVASMSEQPTTTDSYDVDLDELYSNDSTDETTTPFDETTSSEEETQLDTPVYPDPIKLEGKGDKSTDTFTLIQGFATIKLEHKGSRNFAVKLYKEDGEPIKLLVNEIGRYKGETLASIDTEGKYYLEITASGSWKATIDQSIPKTADFPPVKYKGKGDDVIWVNLIPGNVRFTLEHDGNRNFIVKANDSVLLVNEIGKYSGSTRRMVEDMGTYPISINADGNWTLEIE